MIKSKIVNLYGEEDPMYLYCFARSERAKMTGGHLLDKAEGEWITDCENFVSWVGDRNERADSALVLLLPTEAAVKILIERVYPADIRFPVIQVTPDGKYAGVLRSVGYNTHDILSRICSIIGCKPLSTPDDRADFAPDLKKTVTDYKMTALDQDLLDQTAEAIKKGASIQVYSDMPLHMAEPVLDTMSYAPFIFRSNQKRELCQAFLSSCEADEPSIFITCSTLPEVESYGKCLVLIPRTIAVGLEIAARADAEYAVETVRDTLINHEIDPRAVATIAVSDIARDSDAVGKIAESLGCYVTSFDSRLIKAVKVPLNPTYSGAKMTADLCTAAASLASDNGRMLIRRAGSKNSIILTAMMKRGSIVLTE